MMSSSEPLEVCASTSSDENGTLVFQYDWPAKVCQRLVENGDEMILNVSLPFTTAKNGVAFTWCLRLCDECVVAAPGDIGSGSRRQVFLSLYYKDGPTTDVIVDDVKFFLTDPVSGDSLFSPLSITDKEWTKGSGWASELDSKTQGAFTQFIHTKIDQSLNVHVDIKLKNALFQPLAYLPSVDSACRSQRIEKACMNFITEFQADRIKVPEEDNDSRDEKFSRHRMVFVYGCDLVERECMNDKADNEAELLKHIRGTFAHVYFKQVLLPEVKYFDDFVALLEGIIHAQLPSLKRECERFICREVMQECADLVFIKKMLLLAERFNLEVLKMVTTGVLVDVMNEQSESPQDLNEMKFELKQIASEISSSVEDLGGPSEDALVGTVVDDLQSLARRMRRVSLSHSPSLGSNSSSLSSSSSVTPTGSTAHSPSVLDSPQPFHNSPTSRFKRVELDVGY